MEFSLSHLLGSAGFILAIIVMIGSILLPVFLVPRCALPKQPTRFIKVLDQKGNLLARVEAEVVSGIRKQATGMMFRTSMARDTAMMFPGAREVRRWATMRNTIVPLDIVFLSRDGVIKGIFSGVPASRGKVGGVTAASMIEFPKGFCKNHGVSEGFRVLFDGAVS